jgi:STE24 endopeptidase
MFYSQLIVPLFNKQIPLEKGKLRDAIEAFSKKVDFKLDNIYVIDGSKRSSKANAYFAGLGPKKRIVLYDTLINDLDEDEILAVLAHEIGHYKYKHTQKGMLMSIFQTGLILFLFSLVINQPMLNEALGSEHQSFHFGMLVFSFLFEPFSLFIGIFTNIISRKNEYQADEFAQNQGLGEALISGLKKLSRNSLSNLTPHPVYVFVHYSHPTLYQRAKALNFVNRE